MKVVIKNFQSIKYLELEIPEKKFTCIVGPSNIGKSAIRRALGCLFYNKSDGKWIRNGDDSCEVEVLMDDKTHIIWSRTRNGEAKYTINGENFTKLGTSTPQSLIDKGFFELVANKEKYSVQIAPQVNNIFLLNQTGGKVTEVFSNLGNLTKIINSNRQCLSDLKNNKSALSFRRQDLATVKEKIKRYNGVDEQRNIINSLKEKFLEIKNIKEKLAVIVNLNESYIKSEITLKVFFPLSRINVTPLNIDWEKFSTIKNLYGSYRLSQNRLDIFKNLPQKEIEFDLENQHKKYFQIKEMCEKFEKLKRKLILYKGMSKETPVLNIDLEKLKTAKELWEKFLIAKTNVYNLEKQIKDNDEKLQNLLAEKNNIFSTLKFCPVCDRGFE